MKIWAALARASLFNVFYKRNGALTYTHVPNLVET